MLNQLMQIAIDTRIWCKEKGLPVEGVTMHIHPRWRFDLLREAQDYLYLIQLRKSSPSISPPAVDERLAHIAGIPLLIDSGDEDHVLITVERNDGNYRFLPAYDDMPRRFPLEQGFLYER